MLHSPQPTIETLNHSGTTKCNQPAARNNGICSRCSSATPCGMCRSASTWPSGCHVQELDPCRLHSPAKRAGIHPTHNGRVLLFVRCGYLHRVVINRMYICVKFFPLPPTHSPALHHPSQLVLLVAIRGLH